MIRLSGYHRCLLSLFQTSAASAYRASSYNPTFLIALSQASKKGAVVSSCGENVWEGQRGPPTYLVV